MVFAIYEIEVIPGLEELAETELRARHIGAGEVVRRPREGTVRFRYPGNPARLNELRSAIAVYALLRFDVPRPLALLGHENFGRLMALLRQIVALYPSSAFRTFRLSAAGAGSPALTRLRQEIAAMLHLGDRQGPAHLQIALRRPVDGSAGWEVAVRTSPAPLSARAWRVCNMPGALNATIANVMIRLAAPRPGDRFLNIAGGSGTLLVERLELLPAKLAVGIDVSAAALACARENLAASGHAREVALIEGDAAHLPFGSASFDTVVTDLPYGQLVGSDLDVNALYHAVVDEATRVVAPNGRLVAITTRRKLFERALEPFHAVWTLERALTLEVSFSGGYIQPGVYALCRTSD